VSGTVHVIGAGLAGLSAAVSLVRGGATVAVYEAAGHAGGRCRSLHDATLNALIDNGNHLVMAGNRATFAYLDAIGARDRLATTGPAAFPFFDLATGERWTVRPNGGPLPWWLFSPSRRVAGTRALDYLGAFRLAFARDGDTVDQLLAKPETVYRRLWEPLATSALNTDPTEGAAKLLWPVLTQTFLRGEAWCRPYVADEGLSPCFVDPALAYLDAAGATVSFNHRVRALHRADDRLVGLDTTRGPVELGPNDTVILAVPAPAATALLPELAAPTDSRAIVNAHFRLDHAPTLPDGARFLGLVGGTAHWIFVREHIASITVSAADALAAKDNDEIASTLWRDLARALDLTDDQPAPYRIMNERRATFAQTTAAAANRPKTRTSVTNMYLAGDWTDTGLPATIEGAIQSGARAAAVLRVSQS